MKINIKKLKGKLDDLKELRKELEKCKEIEQRMTSSSGITLKFIPTIPHSLFSTTDDRESALEIGSLEVYLSGGASYDSKIGSYLWEEIRRAICVKIKVLLKSIEKLELKL